MSKKLITAVLSGALALSMATVGIAGTSAAVTDDNRYVPDDGVEANRVYFLLPETWVNETYSSDAGAYWWTGTGAGESKDGSTQGVAWPGYRMFHQEDKTDEYYVYYENVYYADVPTDVAQVVFNNYINGGEKTDEDFDEAKYLAAKQTVDVSGFEGICEGDSDDFDDADGGEFWSKVEAALEGNDKSYLGDFADNFYEDEEYGLTMKLNNMIYITNPDEISTNELSGKETYGGRFYFYYGMNDEGVAEYGELPNYDLAKEAGVVYTLAANTSTKDEATPVETAGASGDTKATDNTSSGDTKATDNTSSGDTKAAGATSDSAVPAAATGATSATSAASSTTKTSTSTSSVQTGTATTATAALVAVAVAAGAVIFARKRKFK